MKTETKRNDSIPALYDSPSITKRTAWQNRKIQVAETGPYHEGNTPEYFHTNDYAILFITQGTLSGKFNHLDIEMRAPAVTYIFNDHILHYNSSSSDLRVRLLSYSPIIGEKLALLLPFNQLWHAYVRPALPVDEPDMQTIMHYLDLIEELMQKEKPSREDVIIHLIRSLICFLMEFHTENTGLQQSLTRAEEITGRFLSLVDSHCHEHHDINWYANELHFSPLYVANVVKQVTGSTAGDCITFCIVRQAKSLLLTSTFSIQQISDRLGFKNQSHFGTFFRRATGMSPKAFRNGES